MKQQIVYSHEQCIFYDTDYFKEPSTSYDCYHNNSIKIMELIKSNPNISINQVDSKGYTPIFYAVEGYNIPIIKILITNPSVKAGIKEYKDKDGKTVLDFIKEKEMNHLKYLLDNDKVVFTRRYWEMMKVELEENNLIKNNIPLYLENIFDIALFIQNLYWADGNVDIPSIVTIKDIKEIKGRLKREKEMYDQQLNSKYSKKEIIETNIDGKTRRMILDSHKSTKDNQINYIINPNFNIQNSQINAFTLNPNEIEFQDKIILQLRKTAQLFNQQYHLGYSVFWNNMIAKLNDCIHIKASIDERNNFDFNNIASITNKLKPIVQFIEFQHYEDKTLDGNIYYGYLVRLYTHIIGQILGSNFYNAIEKTVITNLMSELHTSTSTNTGPGLSNIDIRKQNIVNKIKEVKNFIINDIQNKDSLAYLYVTRSMGYDTTPVDDVFEQVAIKLDTLKLADDYKTHLLPYYRTLYRIVFEYLHKMMRNYHKFILNQNRGLKTILLLNQ